MEANPSSWLLAVLEAENFRERCEAHARRVFKVRRR